MHSNSRGLAFLLSIGSLPIACKDGGKTTDSVTDTGGDGMTTGTTSLGNSTTDEPTTGTPTGSGTTTTGEGTTTTSEDPTETPVTTFLTTNTTTDTMGIDTEGVPPATDPQCIAYAAKFVECLPRYSRYGDYLGYYCEYNKKYGLMLDGRGCVDALEAQYVCMTTADCAEYQGDQFPCPEEQALAVTACPNLFMGGSSTDSDGDSDGDSDSSTGL